MSSRLDPSTTLMHANRFPGSGSMATFVTTRTEIIVPILLQIVIALYLSNYVSRGWFPSDEGLIAHSAERVLQGELPHRDFDSPYTGGLSMLHAGAFSVLGVSLVSLRWCLFAFAQLFIASFYILARRCLPLTVAVIVTALAVVWGLPVYFAAMPSWYVLFLEVAATVCVLRFSDSEQRIWLVSAGLLCGLGFLIKITVLYYVAAVLLFFLFRTQSRDSKHSEHGRSSAVFGLTLSIAVTLLGMVAVLLSARFDFRVGLHLFVPILAVCLVLVVHERNAGGTFQRRILDVLRDVVPFVAGAVVPVALFVIPYWQSGSLEQLWRGVFIVPQQRFESVSWPLPPTFWLVTAVPLMLTLYWKKGELTGRFSRGFVILGLTISLGVLCVLESGQLAFNSVWASVRCAGPFVVLAGCWMCLARNQDLQQNVHSEGRQTLFLLTATAAMTGLVQFPVATNPYFLYFAPFVLLAAACAAQQRCTGLRYQHAAVAGFYLLFGLLVLDRTYVANPKVRFYEVNQHVLSSNRSGLLLPEQDRDMYDEIVRLVQQSTSPAEFVYAAPDCPEVYFLANRQNPTRTVYDVFDAPEGRRERIIKLLDNQKTRIVVVNMVPSFSDKLAPELRQAIVDRFPIVQQVGSFVVALREEPYRGSDTASNQDTM